MKKYLLLLIILFVPAQAWAARPLTIEDAGTLGLGAWEIEEGYEIDRSKSNSPNTVSFGTTVKYGILNNFDLGIEVPYSASSPIGVGDATVKAKLSFNESLALGIDLKLANADTANSLGSGHNDYGINSIFSHAFGAATGHLNLAYTIVGQAGGAKIDDNTLSYGAAVEYPLGPAANIMTEIFGSKTPSTTVNPLDALVGFNWALNEILTVDGGLTAGLTNASSEYKATAGATLNL